MPKKHPLVPPLLSIADLLEGEDPLLMDLVTELKQRGIDPARLRERFHRSAFELWRHEQSNGLSVPDSIQRAIEATTPRERSRSDVLPTKLEAWAEHWLERFLIPDTYFPALDAVRAFRRHAQLSERDNCTLNELQIALRSRIELQRDRSSEDFVLLLSRAFLKRFGLECGKRLPTIASDLGLEVLYRPADGYDGVLLRVSESRRAIIVINSELREESRRRFTLAHELAHYLLPGLPAISLPCSKAKIDHWDTELYRSEQDANRFAAEILMPAEWVAPFVALEPSVEAIRSIATMCNTSLSASAVRLIRLTSFRAAIVWSQSGRVVWYKASERFRRWVRKGKLSERSRALRLLEDEQDQDKLMEVPAIAWLFERGLKADATLWEHSIRLGNYDAILTLLVMRDQVEQRRLKT